MAVGMEKTELSQPGFGFAKQVKTKLESELNAKE